MLSPDINESEKLYSVVTDKNGKKAIRYGLLGVKNVGANILDAAIEERKNGRFTSFVDFVSRMCSHELNKRQIEARRTPSARTPEAGKGKHRNVFLGSSAR